MPRAQTSATSAEKPKVGTLKVWVNSSSLSPKQWFSTFPMPHLFKTVPHVVVTSNHEIISLLLHNCNFTTLMNHNVNIWYVTPGGWGSQPIGWELLFQSFVETIFNPNPSPSPVSLPSISSPHFPIRWQSLPQKLLSFKSTDLGCSLPSWRNTCLISIKNMNLSLRTHILQASCGSMHF